jgi:hypothetical protein
MHRVRSGLVELGRDRDDACDRGEIGPLEGARLIPARHEQFEGTAVAAERRRRVGAAHAEDRRDSVNGFVVDREMAGYAGELRAHLVGKEVGPVDGGAARDVDTALALSKEQQLPRPDRVAHGGERARQVAFIGQRRPEGIEHANHGSVGAGLGGRRPRRGLGSLDAGIGDGRSGRSSRSVASPLLLSRFLVPTEDDEPVDPPVEDVANGRGGAAHGVDRAKAEHLRHLAARLGGLVQRSLPGSGLAHGPRSVGLSV